MIVRNIDVVKVSESKKILEIQARQLARGSEAATALLWFAEHVKPNALAKNVVTLKGHIVAGATPGAKEAEFFLKDVLEHLGDSVIDAAIQRAKSAFDMAERIRAGQK